jgi:hypothetical protein
MPYGEVNPVNLEFYANNSAPNVSTMTVRCVITWPTAGTDPNPHQDHATLEEERGNAIFLLREAGKTDGIPEFIDPHTVARKFIDTAAAEEFAGFLIRTCKEHDIPAPEWTVEPISSGA